LDATTIGRLAASSPFEQSAAPCEEAFAFKIIGREQPDVLIVGPGPFFNSRRVQMAQLAARYAAPAIHLRLPGCPGFTSFEYGIGAKWLELLKQMDPRVTRVAVLRDPANPAGIGLFAAMQGVAPSLGVELTPLGMRNADEVATRCRQRLPTSCRRKRWRSQHSKMAAPGSQDTTLQEVLTNTALCLSHRMTDFRTLCHSSDSRGNKPGR
jgi:hypothetical protein